MNKYMVRIELLSATVQEYKNLHTFMEQSGFTRNILRDYDKKVFILPTSDYFIETNLNSDEVLELAKTTSEKTGRIARQLVVKTNDFTWDGLDLAN